MIHMIWQHLSENLEWYWVGGSIFLAIVSLISCGYHGLGEEYTLPGLLVSMIWPLVLFVVLVVLPFAALYWLGKWCKTVKNLRNSPPLNEHPTARRPEDPATLKEDASKEVGYPAVRNGAIVIIRLGQIFRFEGKPWKLDHVTVFNGPRWGFRYMCDFHALYRFMDKDANGYRHETNNLGDLVPWDEPVTQRDT